jgi:tryptophanyl-tRNA synthetase
MGLDDPTSKMSKSAENDMSRISLLDDPGKIKKAIMKATTDSDGVIAFDPENKPGISNLLNIYSALTEESITSIVNRFDGEGYGTFKKALVEVVTDSIAPIRERFDKIRESDELIDILKDGSRRANDIAEPVLERAKERFGLGIR